MKGAVLALTGLAGFAAWALSRGRAEAAAPQLPPTAGDDTDDPAGDYGSNTPPVVHAPPTGPVFDGGPLPSSPTMTPSSPSASSGPASSGRTPIQAAQALLEYVTAAINGGRSSSLGTKSKPNEIVRDCQEDMGTTADGVYGPADRARGKQLLGVDFPARSSSPAPTTNGSKPKPPKPPASAPLPPMEPVTLKEPLRSPPYLAPAPPAPRPAPSSPTATVAPAPPVLRPPPAPPEPPRPAPSSPTATVAPAPRRTPVAAAQALYEYASAAKAAKRMSSLGTKGKPNAVVRDAQADMGTTPDGIYGPADRARGKELLGKTFPAR